MMAREIECPSQTATAAAAAAVAVAISNLDAQVYYWVRTYFSIKESHDIAREAGDSLIDLGLQIANEALELLFVVTRSDSDSDNNSSNVDD